MDIEVAHHKFNKKEVISFNANSNGKKDFDIFNAVAWEEIKNIADKNTVNLKLYVEE